MDEAMVDQALCYVRQWRRQTGKDIEGEPFVSRRPWDLTYLWQELGYFVAGSCMGFELPWPPEGSMCRDRLEKMSEVVVCINHSLLGMLVK